MDYQFRSFQQRSSTYFTNPPYFAPPPNLSYFTQQAIQAGFTAPVDQIRPEFHQIPNHANFEEAMHMQRELEKERIRAEIIAEETMRRRVLEDEVRRDLMMERDFAMRFRSPEQLRFEPRVPLLSNFEHHERFGRFRGSPHRLMVPNGFESLPFQRDPVASGSRIPSSSVVVQKVKTPVQEDAKEKAKPSITSAADLKRKAATQAEGAIVELKSSDSKKQKTKDDWNCALCCVSATSERGLKDHLQGKKHKARETELLVRKTGRGKKSTPSKNPGLKNPPISKNKDEKPQCGKAENPAKKKKNQKGVVPTKPWLENSPIPKDTAAKKKQNEKGVVVPKNLTDTLKPNTESKFWCEVCKVDSSSQKGFVLHEKGKKHLTNLSKVSETGDIKANPSENANEEIKKERGGENVTAENNPITTTGSKDHKVSESATLAEDSNNRVGGAAE